MLKRRMEEKPVRTIPASLLTFGDMMSLLLTFFVMLVSMASFETAKFKIASESLSGAFGVLETFPTIAVQPFVRIPKEDGGEDRRKISIADARKLEKIFQQQRKLGESVKVQITDKGIGILLHDPIGFGSGSADLQGSGAQIVTDVATIVKSTPNLKIRVEGHTDDVPIHTERFHSNWQLSSARALAVVELLAQKSGIDPANMSAVGYGEYRPLVPNTSEENRAKNRRIQIFVDYLDSKPQGK
ncbi:MAG TPA: flagellar motor protein MotB [Fibrobacteraceae bacterium]|nr:flagellar motor protein MotB [Fibrobacteraceae bacterium]